MKRIKELGMNSIAITDHGSMGGTIEYYKAAQEEGIHYLAAVEAYITQDPDNSEEKRRDNNHLVLIAKNNEGLKELYRLTSEANLNNFYYKPRIYIDKLRHTNNLIALSACLGSTISAALLWNKEAQTLEKTQEAEELTKILAGYFPGNFYLELQDHRESWEQIKYNEYLLDLGKKLSLPFVITTDAHYLKKEDFTTHQMVMAQQFKKTIHEYNNQDEMIYGSDHYIQTPNEMMASAQYLNCKEAFYNTQKIADQCKIELELNKPVMPKYDHTKAADYKEFLECRKNK